MLGVAPQFGDDQCHAETDGIARDPWTDTLAGRRG